MRKPHLYSIISLFALLTLFVSAANANLAFAQEHTQHTLSTHVSSGGKRTLARMVSKHQMNVATLRRGTSRPVTHSPSTTLLMPAWNPTVAAQLQKIASHNKNAPRAQHPQLTAPTAKQHTTTPGATNSFQGIASSDTTCPYFGAGSCQPPDQALAASPKWVFQGVNTSFAAYNTSGTIQPGWPLSSQSFFGVPNPPNNCDPQGPFMSDPRAFYDPNDHRFWVAMLQVEGAGGVGDSCPEQSLYWIAVSQTNNPNGSWNIYSFDMSLGTTNWADYVQFGFDQQAIYFSANMFNQAGTAYAYAEILSANKAAMESGESVSAFGFFQLFVSANNTVLVDTVQPVAVEESPSGGPSGGLFVNAFNGGEVHQFNGDPFGDDCITSNCHGIAVWSLTNPGTPSTGLSFAFVDTAGYVLPPRADEPRCLLCIDTLDTRISGTPPYHNGLISFALESNFNNGSQNVAGIHWGQISPQLNSDGTLQGASLFQEGNFFFVGDGTGSFGALMPDAQGDLFMVYEYMDSNINPEVAYTARRVTDPLGSFPDSGFVLRQGDDPTTDGRWGDFEAASYDGPQTNNVWFAGEYAPASGPSNGDWSTFIGEDSF